MVPSSLGSSDSVASDPSITFEEADFVQMRYRKVNA